MPTDRSNQINDGVDFDTGKTYLISGASLQKLINAIKQNQLIAGDGITLEAAENGTMVSVKD
jgi:hypothetical protein